MQPSSVDKNNTSSSNVANAPTTSSSSDAFAAYGKPKRGRGRPKPLLQSVLNRESLMKALDAADVTVTKGHMDGFYQMLHREHYPSLEEFVERYYRNDRNAIRINEANKTAAAASNHQEDGKHVASNNDNNNNNNNTSAANPQEDPLPEPAMRIPLKNPVSNRKNRNRMNLPRPFLRFLADPNNGFVTLTSKVAKVKTSADHSTTKLAVQLYDGQLVESVLMRYGPVTEGTRDTGVVVKKCGRASLCVSSQVGCAMGCNFCATGMMGLTGSLHYSEILEQVILAERILSQEALERMKQEHQQQREYGNNNNDKDDKEISIKNRNKKKHGVASDLEVVRNIVFMGMGEPLDNYANVVTACRAFIDRKRWNLAHGRVTVSTVGIASKIRQLTKDLPEVCLALSLHAPNQKLRSEIVPTAKHYPIEDMIDALHGHMRGVHNRSPDGRSATRRRAMIEYVMLEGETSTLECAHELGKLCEGTEGRSLVVNLIPYNQTDVKDKLRCPSPDHIREFQRIVSSYGPFCTVRRTMGADIDSACGQLITLENEKNEEEQGVRDIEDGLTGGSGNSNPSAKKGVVKKVSQSNSRNTAPVEDAVANEESGIDLERWIRPLQIVTTVAATAFFVSGAVYLRQQRKR